MFTTNTDAVTRLAHGAWLKTSDREYDYFWVRSLDAEGTFTGTRQNRNHVRIDDTFDRYTTMGSTSDLDIDGNVLSTIQAMGQATRIRVPPLS